ncbi:hypothetical protein [Pseudogemmobacter sonorensis]|uniref:hypothetical protein n=1 Tax=Pseudogemmobacter sonorensis TaxID=2989681 RepID=UPI0036CDAA65
MHVMLVIATGLLLLAVFAMFGHLWGHGGPDIARAVHWFVQVWAGLALANLWIGVTKAGYTIAQELPVLIPVFAVPVAVAALVIWQAGRG